MHGVSLARTLPMITKVPPPLSPPPPPPPPPLPPPPPPPPLHQIKTTYIASQKPNVKFHCSHLNANMAASITKSNKRFS